METSPKRGRLVPNSGDARFFMKAVLKRAEETWAERRVADLQVAMKRWMAVIVELEALYAFGQGI